MIAYYPHYWAAPTSLNVSPPPMTTSVCARSSANAKKSEEHRPKKRSKRADARAPGPGASESLLDDRPPARIADSGKPGKASKSCAECRRMKLKCNRIFPCQTCVKRGLEGICPEGSLVTGRGTRYVLAKTEELHEKILLMADRIRDLEDALRSLHLEHAACRVSSSSVTIHPLLRDDLLHIKGQLELYGISYPSPEMAMPACGGANSSQNAYSKVNPTRKDIHETSLQEEYPESDTDDKLDCSRHDVPDDSTNRAAELDSRCDGEANDLTKWKQESDRQRGLRLRALLPSREEAEYFYNVMRMNASWILSIGLTSASCARHMRLMYDAPSSEVTPNEVALFLMFLAVGASIDANLDQGRPGLDTERAKTPNSMKRISNGTPSIPATSRTPMDNYRLAKEALFEVPVQSEPDVQVMKCLFVMAWYHAALTDQKDAGRQAIVTISLAVKVAMKLGLQREETYECMPPEDQQELRVIFWAILHAEARFNLGANRPSSTSLTQVTCKQQRHFARSDLWAYRIETISHNYRTAFLEECIIPVLEASSSLVVCGIAAYDYLKVLELDWKIREFPALHVPESDTITETLPYSHGDVHNPGTSALTCVMLRAHALQEKQVVLMQLHRLFWLAHVRDHSTLVQRRFFPSAVATFNSACILVKSVHDVWLRAPELAARISTFWYNAFSGAVSFFVLVMAKPFCPVTPLALQELDKTTQLFLEASSKCFMAARAHPILREFNAKATEIYNRWKEQTEDDMNVFGPNGEVTVCESRIDVIVERLQRLPLDGMDKKDMVGESNIILPSMRSQAPEETKSPPWPSTEQLETAGDPTHVPEFYEMWQYVHQDLNDIVRRMPGVLKDALVDPRLVTAASLLWGFVPSTPITPEPVPASSNASMHIDVDPVFPSDLDWNTLTNALMDTTSSTCQELPTPDSMTATLNSDGPEPEAHTFFPLLDTCSAFGRVYVDTPEADSMEAASGSHEFGSFCCVYAGEFEKGSAGDS